MNRRNIIGLTRSQEIADLAEEIAGLKVPVNPLGILSEQRNLRFVQGNFGDAFDGLLEWRDRGFWVYCNSARVGHLDTPRARFTIGHELGHYFIDEHRNALSAGLTASHPSFSEYQSDELVEREADLFASHLLMPTAAFEASMKKAPRGLQGVLKLKEQFRTSITSTAIKYVRSANFFCVVVKWNPDGFGWRWSSQEAHNDGYIRTIQQHRRLPFDSATRIAMNQRGAVSDIVEKGAVASMWFDFIPAGTARDTILKEQAISLGQYGYLTMLSLDDGK